MEDEELVPLKRKKEDKSGVAPVKIQNSKYVRHSGKKEELRRLKRKEMTNG